LIKFALLCELPFPQNFEIAYSLLFHLKIMLFMNLDVERT